MGKIGYQQNNLKIKNNTKYKKANLINKEEWRYTKNNKQ